MQTELLPLCFVGSRWDVNESQCHLKIAQQALLSDAFWQFPQMVLACPLRN